MPRVAVDIEAKAPSARRVVVPDTGRLATMEAPEFVNEGIDTFLVDQHQAGNPS